jgi:hypothetical protein
VRVSGFDPDPQIHVFCAERGLQSSAAAVLRVEREKVDVGQVLRANYRTPRQWVTGGHHNHTGAVEKLRVLKAFHRHLIGHQAQIELAAADRLMHVPRAHDLQRNLHIAFGGIECGDYARQKAVAQGRVHGNR